jgi:hypothetical protein
MIGKCSFFVDASDVLAAISKLSGKAFFTRSPGRWRPSGQCRLSTAYPRLARSIRPLRTM